MIELGQYNTLEILRHTPPGLFLGDTDGNEVLLPNRYVPDSFEIGDTINVFIYLDNEERPVATTDQPYITRNNFALLRCNEVTKFGAFLDWGLVKELFCPFKEQAFKMKKGGWYFVYCYLDEATQRLVASSKTKQFLDNKNLTVQQFDEVDIIISHPSEIGMNVIINNIHAGLIYKDEIFKELQIGDKLKGIIKKIRPDNKIDVSLSQIGYRNIEPNSKLILDFLEHNGGFLLLHDKSEPEEIKTQLQMSKKAFKKAVGNLYKEQKITIKPDGIYLK